MDELLNKYDYQLPKDLIANAPVTPRDRSKLLILERSTGGLQHRVFKDLSGMLTQNDVLVLNQTKVFPARIYGHKATGGKVEVLLTHQSAPNTWWVISKPALRVGQIIKFDRNLLAEVVGFWQETGQSELRFNPADGDLDVVINDIGKTPIPPYISSDLGESEIRERYQTVFAKDVGSSAAPTAGLHFTDELLKKLRESGVQIEFVTLHVGPGTFQNLRPENIKSDQLHVEECKIDNQTAIRLVEAKKSGKRIIAVGTTVTRVLESAINTTDTEYSLKTGLMRTDIFIHYPYRFRFVDSLITNFHLPKSSLLMLAGAFVSAPNTEHDFDNLSNSILGNAYLEAIEHKYRFYSFGDAMWIV